MEAVCHSSENSFMKNAQDNKNWKVFEYYTFTITAASFRAQWVNILHNTWPVALPAVSIKELADVESGRL